MQSEVKIYPPMAYSQYWLYIWIAFGVLIVLWYLMIFRLTRKCKVRIEKLNIDAMKQDFLKQLDDIEMKVNSHEYSSRVAYQKVSILLRTFASDIYNIPAQSMTLEEIKQTNAVELSQLIESLYPSEFKVSHSGDIYTTIRTIREAVQLWN